MSCGVIIMFGRQGDVFKLKAVLYYIFGQGSARSRGVYKIVIVLTAAKLRTSPKSGGNYE